jgi:RimJ/RimL family protein N-acetyltransferase
MDAALRSEPRIAISLSETEEHMRFEIPELLGRRVRLAALTEAHREPLRRVADDERIWEFTLTRGCGPGFDPWFDEALAERDAGRRWPFAVQRLSDGHWIGSSSYLDPSIKHLRVEIGSTWYRPDSWGTAINPECKLLLLAHAFEAVAVNRVSLVTDALNVRSQAAIAKLGAKREGTLRSHMVSQGGRIRDSVVFSIIAAEWPAVRAGLEAGTAPI